MKDHTNIQGQNQGQLQDHHQGQPQGHQVHILGLLIKDTQGEIKQRHNKSKVHKHRRHASSSSRSQSRSSRSRSHRPKGRSRLCNTKRSSSSRSRSRSPSKSKSYRTKRSRSRKSKRSSQKHHSLSSDSNTDTSVNRHSNRHGDPRKHPKALRFDGKSNWLSFRKKFDSYRKVMKWSETESKDYLMWSLEGKALDFFTITTTDIEKDSFHRIIKKTRG